MVSTLFQPGNTKILGVLLLVGCSGNHGAADKPFRVADLERFHRPGVYDTYRKSHNVWLVSNGRMLVALWANCPSDEAGTVYDPGTAQFRCPRDASRFGSQGLNRGTSRANRPLERCKIEPIRGEEDGAVIAIRINPARRYRQDRNEWSQRYSLHPFDGG